MKIVPVIGPRGSCLEKVFTAGIPAFENSLDMISLIKGFKAPFGKDFQLVVKLTLGALVSKGDHGLLPAETEVPTYLQSDASTLVTDIDCLFFFQHTCHLHSFASVA
eukprot:TRINITY_DN77752_c0_g1_i1.p3 TRINITY_DN77752_c0_g1~~TRINITY_DN77752_c0_g1_i1.p3  ORF type:complete len:107 (+),score=12.98 TRINITY_DN77752_c0_g1_i1:151-471(+)